METYDVQFLQEALDDLEEIISFIAYYMEPQITLCYIKK